MAASEMSAVKTLMPPTTAPRETLSPRRWLTLPAILYLIILTQIPVLFTLYYSTLNWNILRPDRITNVGLGNYPRVVQDVNFWPIISNTIELTVSVLLVTLVLGMILALLLNRSFPGRGILRTLLITPFLVMPTVAAVLWKNVLMNPAFGLLSSTMAVFGLPRVDWLATYPMYSVIAVIAWQWTPFMMLILLAGLQSLPGDQLESAQIDGAGLWQIFRYIVLPHLRRYIEIAVLMEVLFILSIFGEIFVTTSGGPGTATTNLAYDIYQEAFQRRNIGLASALGVYAVIFANIVVALFIRILRRGESEGAA
jgi:sorbitol/mannitol transport system permease protein